jgi:hypothetical protein
MPDIVLRRAGQAEFEVTGSEAKHGMMQIARRDGTITTWVMLDGNRATAELPPGEFLAVLHSGTARAASTFTIRTGERTHAVLAFAPAIAVTLACTRDDTRPDELLHLVVHDAAGELLDCVHLHPRIEPAVWNTLLPPGPCTVTVHTTDGRATSTSLRVRAEGGAQSFALDLPKR